MGTYECARTHGEHTHKHTQAHTRGWQHRASRQAPVTPRRTRGLLLLEGSPTSTFLPRLHGDTAVTRRPIVCVQGRTQSEHTRRQSEIQNLLTGSQNKAHKTV